MAAAKNSFQTMVLTQVKEAEKRVLELEKEVVTRARQQRRELKALVARIQSGKELKAWSRRASIAGTQVKKRLGGFQQTFVSGLGVASAAQVAELNKELSKLAKKVEGLRKKPTASA